MTIYINVKQGKERETVEEFNRADYDSVEAYRRAVAIRLSSYRMTYRNSVVYPSTRACKGWTGN